MLVRERKKRTFKRDKWSLLSRGRRRVVLERFCPKCERPYDPTPRPKEEKQFISGSAAAFVYSTTRYGRLEFAVRFGRWQAHAKTLWLSELFGPDDLVDLAKVAAQARDYIDARIRSAPKTAHVAARRHIAGKHRQV